MPKILRLERDDEGRLDLYLPTGAARAEVLDEPDATRQRLRDALLLARGDWFLDLDAGLDGDVAFGARGSLRGGFPLIPPEVEVRRVLAAVPGVRFVRSVEVRALRDRADAASYGASAAATWDRLGGRAYLVLATVVAASGDVDVAAPLSLAPIGI